MSAKVYDLTVRLKGENADYRRSVKQASRENKHFTTSVQGMSRGLTAVEGPLNGFAGRFSALSGIISGPTAAVSAAGAAFAGLALMMGKAVSTASKYEVEALKQQQLLQATGYAAGLTASELQSQASQVALTTLASVQGIQEAQGVLLTFKSVQGATFNEAIELSQDMAAVFGGSAKDKAQQLGKALEDPVQGINALKRSGVSFNETQREMIKNMVETGNKADAQRMILDELQQQVGGAAAGQAGGLAGSVDTLSQRWDEFKLALTNTTDADTKVSSFLDGLATRIDRLNKLLDPPDQDKFDELVRERIDLKQKLEGLGNGERTTLLSWIVGPESEWLNLQRRLTEVNAELSAMQNARKDEIIEQGKAAEGAAKQAKINSTAPAADPDAVNAATGLKPSQVMAELEKMEAAWQTSRQREQAAYQARNDMIDNALEMDQITESYWQELRLQNWANFETARTELQRQESEKRLEQQEEERRKIEESRRAHLDNLVGFNGMIVDTLRSAGKEQSAIYKIAFAAQKAAAIPSMIVSTEEAATSAMAMAPGPAGIALAGMIKGFGYASVGIAAGQTIAGIAHGGLGYVPEEATYLLQKGESVLSPRQNVELSKAADRINSGAASQIIVNLYEDSSKAGSVEREQGPNAEEILNIFVESIRYGGAAATELETRYDVNRRA